MSRRLLPSTVTWSLTPMLVSMRVFGLVWPSPAVSLVWGNSRWRMMGRLHCLLVSVTVAAHAGRFLAFYMEESNFGPLLVLKVLTHTWSLEKLLVNIVVLRGVYTYMGRVLRAWETYKARHQGVSRCYMRNQATKIVLYVNMVFLISSISSIFLFSFFTKQFTYLLLTPFYTAGQEVPLYVAFISYTLYFYLAFSWLQPILLLCVTCFLLRREFQRLTYDLRAFLSDDDVIERAQVFTQEVTLEHFRRRHDSLCHVVGHVDNMLGLFCLVIYVLSVPLVCMFVFTLFYAREVFGDDPLAIAASVVCLLVAIVHVIIITVIATSLITAAKSPKKLLYSLDLHRYSEQEIFSIQAFLFRLSTEHLGITLWKLVNIDRRLFVTLCAVVVSYILLLFKLSLALGAAHCPQHGAGAVITGSGNTTDAYG